MASVEVRIAASADDAGSTTSNDTSVSGHADWGYEATSGNVGGAALYFLHFRWPVAIAAGATINDGTYIRLTARSSDTDANTGLLEVYNEHNCEDFTNAKRDDARIAGKSVAWTIGPLTANSTYDSPEIKELVQAWLDLASHVSGDYFGVQFGTEDTDYLYQGIEQYDHDDTKAALLHIEYTIGGVEHTHSASDTMTISDSIATKSVMKFAKADTMTIGDAIGTKSVMKYAAADQMDISDSATFVLTEAEIAAIRRLRMIYGLQPARVPRIGRIGV